MKAIPWHHIKEDQLVDGVRRRIVTGEKVMLGRIYFPKGAIVPLHQHESEQITHVLSGALRFEVAGQEVIVKAGEILHIPSNTQHSAEALEECDEIDAFSPIRADWLDGSDVYMQPKAGAE